jgi:ectoine hydroxylase-related dioxygenase (phytanoyl-CoA dioxygenase family)
MLSKSDIDRFWREGCLVVPGAVSADQLAAMRAQIADWVEESRAHREPFGAPTVDGRPRFDMGEEHRPEKPALRRINNPSDASSAFAEVAWNGAVVDMVADLIGPDLKFHHCKINLKLPGSNTEVGYHQDFAYTPHTNDDIVTALIFVDEVTADNGALMVVPGSHRGPIYSLFEGERFAGAIEPATAAALRAKQVPAIGPAGSVCLMHTRLCHGSEANLSDRSRGLYICVYTAADAFPLARNPMANPHEGKILRGKATRFARMMEGPIELPAQPRTASFFAVQGQRSAGPAAE